MQSFLLHQASEGQEGSDTARRQADFGSMQGTRGRAEGTGGPSGHPEQGQGQQQQQWGGPVTAAGPYRPRTPGWRPWRGGAFEDTGPCGDHAGGGVSLCLSRIQSEKWLRRVKMLGPTGARQGRLQLDSPIRNQVLFSWQLRGPPESPWAEGGGSSWATGQRGAHEETARALPRCGAGVRRPLAKAGSRRSGKSRRQAPRRTSWGQKPRGGPGAGSRSFGGDRGHPCRLAVTGLPRGAGRWHLKSRHVGTEARSLLFRNVPHALCVRTQR